MTTKNKFLILSIMAMVALCSCKTTSKVAQADDEIITVTETLPEFPGGTEQMMAFLSKHVKYPAAAKGEQGVVPVRFVVEKDGSLSNFEAMTVLDRKVHPALVKEAIKTVKKMPKWSPATNGGKPARCYITIPIRFIP